MQRGLVIIPAYNEEKSIGEVIQGIQEQGLDMDILVVNDGSLDDTERIAKRHRVFVVTHPTNLGYGAAVQTGYKFADRKGYAYVIQFDADGQHDPSTLLFMMEAIERGDADIVIGSRFLTKTRIEMNVGPFKRAVASLFRWVIRVITGTNITDTTSGLRALTKQVYSYYAVRNRFPMEYPDADFLIQMLYRKYRIKEIQANMKDRAFGKSLQHGGLKPIIYMFRTFLNIFVVLLQHKFMLVRNKHNV